MENLENISEPHFEQSNPQIQFSLHLSSFFSNGEKTNIL